MKTLRKNNLRFAPLPLLFLLAAAGCSLITEKSGPKYPSHDAYVTDTAEIISPQLENELEALITSLESKTTAQVAVVTVSSTEPESIEQYAVKLYEKWGIGEKSKDNGVLLLIAIKNERSSRIRIEVGHGLEGAINDAWCGRVIREVMAPYCKAGDMDRCVASGAIAIVGKAAGEYKYKLNESAKLVPADGAAPPPDAQTGKPAGAPFRDISGEEVQKTVPATPAGIVKNLFSNIASIIVIILMIILFITNPRLFFLLLFMRGGGGGGWSSGDRGGFGGGFGGFGGGSSGGGGATGGW